MLSNTQSVVVLNPMWLKYQLSLTILLVQFCTIKYWEAGNPCFIHHGVSYKHYNSKISVLTVLHSEYLRYVDHDVLAIKVEVFA